MTAYKLCKAAGLSGMKELAERTGYDTSTLRKYYNENRKRFDILLNGAALQRLMEMTK